MTAERAQLPLALTPRPSLSLKDFVVSESNRDAFALVNGWPHWPSHGVALVGPPDSGKTHLGEGWRARSDGRAFGPDDDPATIAPGEALLLEDVDRRPYAADQLFHLFNWSRETGGSLLMTGRLPPSQWPYSLPDLTSRLATLSVGTIHDPDDQLMMVLLLKLFSDRQLQVDLRVINYIIPRVERSFHAANRLVAQLDRMALAEKRGVTIALARACLAAGADATGVSG
ncbi:HdaA/DnaA family protein [Yunchengibacter salinarum]|uniref:HdaA/DnaA family protein n=1 Tax=Yunchengibacter salinarum TaxID=3133399 RepID=UPI0035B667B7